MAACGAPAADGMKVGLVTDTGGINDKSFNQGTWEGVQSFVGTNPTWTASYLETAQDADIVPNLNTSAATNDIIVAPGFKFAEGITVSAQANPDTKYVLLDAEPVNEAGEPVVLENVASYFVREEQAGYLAGVAAAENTEKSTLGFIGGIPVPAVQNFVAGYIQGAKSVKPEIKVDVQYANSFTDSSIGKQKAQAMYSSGIDTIFVAAGGVGTGAIEEAIAQNNAGNKVWLIGVDRDQYEDGMMDNGQSVFLTSAVKQVGAIAETALTSTLNGEDIYGQTLTLDYSDGAVGLPEENPSFTKDVGIAVDAAKILMGKEELEIKNFTEFDVVKSGLY